MPIPIATAVFDRMMWPKMPMPKPAIIRITNGQGLAPKLGLGS